MPRAELFAVVEPHYPKGRRGRPQVGLEPTLRVYVVHRWNGLSDEGVDDAITDSQALRAFVGIDLCREVAPDATTVLQFRHLLEPHVIAAPSSVKNEANARDPDMHQTKKRQTVALRHEGPHWRRCLDRAWCTPSSERRRTSRTLRRPSICCTGKRRTSSCMRAISAPTSGKS